MSFKSYMAGVAVAAIGGAVWFGITDAQKVQRIEQNAAEEIKCARACMTPKKVYTLNANDDPYQDIAVLTWEGKKYIFLGDENGTFTPSDVFYQRQIHTVESGKQSEIEKILAQQAATQERVNEVIDRDLAGEGE